MQADGCRILSLNSRKGYLITVGTYGLSDLYLKKGPLDARKSLPDILDGKMVFIADAAKDERVQYPEIALAQGISSIIGVPILGKEEAIGEIRIYTHEHRQFSEADKSFLHSAADMCAVVFERVELQQLLEQDRKTRGRRKKSSRTHTLAATLESSSFAHPSEEDFAKLFSFTVLNGFMSLVPFLLDGKATK